MKRPIPFAQRSMDNHEAEEARDGSGLQQLIQQARHRVSGFAKMLHRSKGVQNARRFSELMVSAEQFQAQVGRLRLACRDLQLKTSASLIS